MSFLLCFHTRIINNKLNKTLLYVKACTSIFTLKAGICVFICCDTITQIFIPMFPPVFYKLRQMRHKALHFPPRARFLSLHALYPHVQFARVGVEFTCGAQIRHRQKKPTAHRKNLIQLLLSAHCPSWSYFEVEYSCLHPRMKYERALVLTNFQRRFEGLGCFRRISGRRRTENMFNQAIG